MTVAELLSHLHSLGIKLWLEGDRLCYKAPQEALTPVLRAELAERKADVIAFLRSAETAVTPAAEPIRPLSRDERPGGGWPLSFAQQRLWFLDQLAPASPIYRIPVAYRLEGPLNVSALAQSLNEIVRRHEALRTTFEVLDGQPVQIIARLASLALPIVDLRALPEAGREDQARRQVAAEVQRPFDLARGPLLRAMLLQLSAREHVLLLTMHHIISDGWSTGVFNRELSALYEALCAGNPSPLPALPIQYADYAVWQRQWLQGKVLEAQLAYWKERLAGHPPRLELPTDRPRPPAQTFKGLYQPFALHEALSAALKALSKREGVTLFMALLAAFKTLLYRYTGQTDVVVGLPVANRNRVEIEGLIGFFVNTLALRTDLSDNPTFRELLGRVRETVLGAHTHQDLPFEKLVEELQPERNLSHNPLFQVMFAFENEPPATPKLPGVATSPFEAHAGAAEFDWVIAIEDTAREIKGFINYNTDLFDEATITRLLGHYQTLLESVVATGDALDQRLSDLSLLTEDERQQLLVEWNHLDAGHQPGQCFHHLFEAQVERRPDAVAVFFGTETLTYAGLNRRANQLAHHLQKMGVGPEVCVGICVERSQEMVLAVLGVLKAGGAYLPLDPTHPQARLAFMLEDARPAVLLTQTHLREHLPALSYPYQMLCLDADWPDVAQESAQNPARGAAVDNLAYVIYTSGSTGLPKGVWVTHRGIGNVSEAQIRAFGVRPGSRVLQFSNLTFDASVFEMIMALGSGATLCLGTREALLPGEGLLDFLHDLQVSVVTLTPSALAALPFHELPALKTITVAGEACPAELVARWVLGRNFFNLYGPTEDTIWTTMSPCVDGHAPPPIGRPISRTQVYVLDANMQPVPVGVPGELHVGGVGLARGYLNRPDLTAERFIPHLFPLLERAGARLYKTGDLVRYLPNGDVEFLGRTDDQVKIRGYRIELGEIEAVLERQPGVREAVVLAREDGPGDRRLVAYVVPTGGRSQHGTMQMQDFVGELQSDLRAQLPGYMVPLAFVMLEALPLTTSGKVDRRALPAPDRSAKQAAFVAPRTPVEARLAAIMEQVLGLERLGVNDDFFALGGHSLLVTQLVSRVNLAFQVTLPVRAVFEQRTVAGLAGLVIHAQKALGLQASPIAPAPRAQPLPLSFAQQRLWLIDQLAPGSPVYNISVAHRLGGSLDVAALERSLSEIIRRHEILRTTFTTLDGQPVQVIAPALCLSLPVVNLRGLGLEREAEARRLGFQDAQRPFDLTRLPLLRATLLRLGQREHVLLLTMHHIVSDEWSANVFNRELATLYEAFSTDETFRQTGRKRSPLPELAIQYADFALWQREWLRGEVLQAQLDYWRQQLDGLATLELPTDRPQPAAQTFRGAEQSFVLAPSLFEALKRLSQQQNVTLFMTLLAVFKTLLYRYTGQTDVAVGTAVAGRNRVEIEELIGFFVNTLVLRTDLGGNPTFRELLERVREVTLGAFTHQDLPFERLVEALQPERHLSHNPLFQVMFSLQGEPPEPPSLAGLAWQSVEVENETAKFDLTLTICDTGPDLKVTLGYNTDLFDARTITRMAGHFQTLLAGIATAEGADQRLSDLPLLTQVERRQLLVEWNDTHTSYPRDQNIHALFEAQVEQTPDAVALVFSGENQHLTCRELNRRANQLAHYVRALGVGPETLVGLCVERSLEMIVGTLGILKAGAAYVPLDPAYPKERLAFMLQDTRAPVLLTQAHLMDQLPDQLANQPTLICLNADWTSIARESCANPANRTTSDNLAYVMYTSGSTGTPKGVSIVHRGVTRLVQETNYANLNADEVLLQFAPSSFDASTLEIWGSLLNGARLVVFPAHTPSLEELGQVLQQHGVTTLWLTAGLFHLMVNEQLESLGRVRQLLAGGDVLSVPHVQKVLREIKGCRMINGYGPTENTTFTTCHPMTPDTQVSGSVPIGKPIANTQVYVLDACLQPVPVGVSGELYIAGDGLARAYLKRPALTAETFVPNPFGEKPGGRLYRTGDRVRYRPDGSIEFFGRLDHQVKIRGFRIELGEIEALLAQHPAVREAVVLAREDVRDDGDAAPGDKRLVAYVVPHVEQDFITGDLRHFLRDRLPEYMLPSAFVVLAALPLTPNGKVDRRALPTPQGERPELGQACVAPRTPAEELLAGIWAQVLHLERVGVTDNFFELGGHSLLATQVVSRVRQTLQVELPLRYLFEEPTIAGLARSIVVERREEQGLTAPPLVRAVRGGALPLSFAQQRLWFLDQLEPGSAVYNVPAAMHLAGCLDMAALVQSINAVVRRHEALRTTFEVQEELPVQVIAPDLAVPMPVINLQVLSPGERAGEVRRLSSKELQRPFDLACGPLVRASLLRLEADDHVLLLTLHHIVSDGWSMGILLRELAALYQALSAGQPSRQAGRRQSPLPELPIQYTDFAIWQRRWLQGEVLENQLAYWREQLAGAPSRLELPADRPRPPIQTYRGAEQSFVLSASLANALKTLSRQMGATLFMVLLAAFKALLYHYTGHSDVLVGTPIANRNRAEVEGLIGFFVNTLVLRTDLAGNPTFSELVGRVREVALDAYVHQDLPFEHLVDALQPERDLSYTPFFQVMFVLHNAPAEVLKAPGLTMRPLELEGETAKFDLTLFMRHTERGLKGALEYNTDLFDAATITRLVGHFKTLLAGVTANSEQRLAALPLLTEAERQQLLEEWNDTQADYSLGTCLHRLFEAQVERSPDTVALVLEGVQFTYGELNARANQLARYLRRRGVGPEVLVGLYVERSPEMVVGILGVLKAGGAYVPLDPVYPPERVAFMLQDAQTPLVLAQERLASGLAGCLAEIVCLDSDWPQIAGEGRHNLAVGAGPGNAVYVIYTSGSTGRPKGTVLTHANVARLMRATEEWYHFDARDVWTWFHSCAFDFSVWEMWGALAYGGRLVLVPYWVSRSPEQFYALLAQERVTVLNQTPSAFQQLMHAGEQTHSRPTLALRWVIFGGEALELQSLRPWYQRHGDERPRLVNMYGITEATVHVTYRPLGRADLDGAPGSVIGGPIPDLQVYVLGAQMQLVPLGVMGELYVGGAGVGRGYLGRADLTAARFVPNPFSPQPGARLYKTGDLARRLPGGDLEYGGRIDHQVKIRGFRVELGEIESALNQHPQVRETVVVTTLTAREENSAPGQSARGKSLVAYLVPRGRDAPSAHELRSHLQRMLPEYMLPALFVPLKALPLTPTGKVDRRALPAPDRSTPERAFVAPRNPVEEMLADVWAQVLGLERVGVYDNFFALGGHSLLATQIVARLRQVFGHSLPVRALFEAPTVAALVGRFEALIHAGDKEVPPIVRVPREGHLPLSFSQQQLWLVEQLAPGNVAYNVPFALRLSGPLDVAALQDSLDEIVRRHEVLRTTFPTQEGRPVQRVASSWTVFLPLIDLHHWPADKREAVALRLAEKEACRPFDLAQGPLMRAALFRTGEAEHLLLVTIHHVVFDGWSIGLFLSELEALYRVFSTGEPARQTGCKQAPLPELPIQYTDYAAWQRAWLQGQALQERLAYWERQLQGAPALTQLPTDRPRPPIQTFRGASQALVLPSGVGRALKTLSRQQGVTLFMTLLAAFKVLLHRYTGQTDLVVGTPVANRDRFEIEGLIGYFVNMLVLRTDLAGEPTFHELLARVRETALNAYAHQELPFEKLVEALQPERDASHNPLFQVIFSLGAAMTPPALPGLSVTLQPVETGTYQAADLHLQVEEAERGLSVSIRYNTDLFNDDTIARILQDYQTLLENVVAAPEQALWTLLPSPRVKGRRSGEALPPDLSPEVAPPGVQDDMTQRKTRLSDRRSRLSATQRARLEQRLRGE